MKPLVQSPPAQRLTLEVGLQLQPPPPRFAPPPQPQPQLRGAGSQREEAEGAVLPIEREVRHLPAISGN